MRGTVLGSPNTAAVEEKTRFLTPVSAMAWSSSAVPPVLLAKYLAGSRTDSPTSIQAARCMTASGRWRHDAGQKLTIQQIAGFKGRLYGAALAIHEVVRHDDVVALLLQELADKAADIASPAGYQDLQDVAPLTPVRKGYQVGSGSAWLSHDPCEKTPAAGSRQNGR